MPLGGQLELILQPKKPLDLLLAALLQKIYFVVRGGQLLEAYGESSGQKCLFMRFGIFPVRIWHVFLLFI